MEFKSLQNLKAPLKAAELTPEAQAFKAYKLRASRQETSSVVNLAFSPNRNHNQLAVCSGTKVGLWRTSPEGELKADGTITKFKDVTQCVAWRSDGKLLLAGEASGSCAVVNVETKGVLRRFRGHGDAVTCCSFAEEDRSRAATGGKDGKLRIWDVTTSDLLHTVRAHGDRAKVLLPWAGGPDMWVTAGYDGRVRLWDLRAGGFGDEEVGAGAVAMANHGCQIEAGVSFPKGSLFATAGGTEVKIWDLAAGGRLVQELDKGNRHAKAVTSICLDTTASVLLTASFDGYVKVHRAADLSHLWTYQLPGPAISIAWRPDDRGFAVGLDDGCWQMRMRKLDVDIRRAEASAAKKAKAGRERLQNMKGQSHKRGKDRKPDSDDEVVDEASLVNKRQRKENTIDFLFRKFEYQKALQFMMLKSTSHEVGLAIVDELLQRSALTSTLRSLSEEMCLDLMCWMLKVFGKGDSLHHSLLLELIHALLDTNEHMRPPASKELILALQRLDDKVSQEMTIQRSFMETSGMLKTVMSL